MNLSQIKSIAEKELLDKSSHSWKDRGNKYFHGERVAKLAITLRKIVLPDVSSQDEILTVAAWFHDIENGCENHNEHGKIGAIKVKELLRQHCTENELAEICEIITLHDNRNKDEQGDYSTLIKLHQDADHLDHFGTFDLWSAFLYAVPHNINMIETIEYLKNERPLEDDKFINELNYNISRMIYAEKSRFRDSFANRFALEADGEFWELPNILNNYKGEE